MTYYDTPAPDEPEDAGFAAFQKMQRDIEELKKMVFTQGNVLRDVVNKGQGLAKQADAMADHLRSLSRSVQFRPRPSQPVIRSEPPPAVIRRPVEPPTPPGALVDVPPIRDAQPVETTSTETSRGRRGRRE